LWLCGDMLLKLEAFGFVVRWCLSLLPQELFCRAVAVNKRWLRVASENVGLRRGRWLVVNKRNVHKLSGRGRPLPLTVASGLNSVRVEGCDVLQMVEQSCPQLASGGYITAVSCKREFTGWSRCVSCVTCV